tara:strand:+ start:603 stop:704 length:102 start_codon:yes stop_codon:yes gene_type:complete
MGSSKISKILQESSDAAALAEGKDLKEIIVKCD